MSALAPPLRRQLERAVLDARRAAETGAGKALRGLGVFAPERRLVFSKPFLPQFLPQVGIRDLKVGDASVDLLLTRHDEGDVGVNVLRRNGILDVVVLK